MAIKKPDLTREQIEQGYAWRTYVCTGRDVLLSGGKIGVELCLYVSDGANLGEPVYVSQNGKASKAAFKVGGVYSVPVKDLADGFRMLTGYATWEKMYYDTDRVAAWQLASKARETTARARRLETKAFNHDYLAEILAPVIDAYSQTDYSGRIAIELLVIQALRRGHTEKMRRRK